MELLPEVRAASLQLAALTEDTVDLVSGLEAVCDLAQSLLPSCVGVSMTVIVDGDPFTITATSEQAKAVDAVQYLDDGPCLGAATGDTAVLVDDVLHEGRWQYYAQAAVASGIRASMSIPLKRPDGQVYGALNLYASHPGAFRDKEQQLAGLFGVRVEELVANADLSFMTREHAKELPQRLDEHARLNQAVGVLMARNGWAAAEARERFEFAAAHAKVARADVARIVLVLGT